MALAIAERIKPASEIRKAYGLNLLIFGASRSGKTTFAATAAQVPEMRDVLIVATEDGLASVDTNQPGLSYVVAQTEDDLIEVLEYIDSGDHPFKTVVIDSLNAVANILKASAEEELGVDKIAWQDYSTYTDKVVRFVRRFRQFCSAPDKGYNVIFTSMTREKKTKSGIVTALGPDLSPSLSNGVCMTLDGIGFLDVNDEGQRVLSFEQTSTVYAGYRQPPSGSSIPLNIVNPTMEILYKAAKGDVPQGTS